LDQKGRLKKEGEKEFGRRSSSQKSRVGMESNYSGIIIAKNKK